MQFAAVIPIPSGAPTLLALVLAAALFLVFPERVLSQEQDGPEIQAAEYSISINGAPSEEVEESLLAVSEAARLTDRPPPSIRLLERRASRDLQAFRKALESFGFFKAEAEYTIDAEQTPAALVFTVNAGPRFVLAEVLIRAETGADSAALPSAGDIGLETGEPYSANAVVQAQGRLLNMLGKSGRPFPKVVDRRVAAHFDDNGVRVEFLVDPGPPAVFGETRITGLTSVKEEHARALVPWRRGEAFDVSLINTARRAFFESGLFAKVEIGHAEDLVDGGLPMNISLAERDHRTARAGLEYNTDFGPGVTFGWEHRNYMGSGETLAADLTFNDIKRNLEAALTKPRFWGAEQDLVVKTSLGEEDTEAFTSRGLDSSALVERDVRGLFSVGYGAGYRYSRVKDKDDEDTDTFGHAYVPLSIARDKRDSVLDPTRGYRVGFQVAPYLDTLGSEANFFKYGLSGSWYQEVMDQSRMVLAARAVYGAITGAGREQIPADLRFYAGGGGTIRGYAYQTAGGLDEDDEPVGGKSMLAASMEVRFKISESMGFSPFVDAGRAYERGHPDFEDDLFWGAGLGFQYYTDFGPIRVDAAVPLNRRADVDEPFQIYVSLGQSF